MTSVSEGPYENKPSFDPPPMEYRDASRWCQVRNGDWWAFYTNTGPDASWCIEHPYDPNFWARLSSPKEEWGCRHGWIAGTSACGECCVTPIVGPSDEQISEARLQAMHLLDGIV